MDNQFLIESSAPCHCEGAGGRAPSGADGIDEEEDTSEEDICGGLRLGSGNAIAEGGGSPRWGVPMAEEALACSDETGPPLIFGENCADLVE